MPIADSVVEGTISIVFMGHAARMGEVKNVYNELLLENLKGRPNLEGA